jgi:hypothetical protein
LLGGPAQQSGVDVVQMAEMYAAQIAEMPQAQQGQAVMALESQSPELAQLVQQFLQPPVVLDRSSFPNQATFINSVATWGRATPFFEQRKTFRFTISRTF